MKRILCSFIFLGLLVGCSQAQDPSPSLEKNTTNLDSINTCISAKSTRYCGLLFKGIENNLTIEIPPTYVFEIEACTVAKRNADNYTVTPSQTGDLSMTVYQSREDQANNKLFKQLSLRAIELPMPVIKMDVEGSRYIDVKSLNKMKEFECRQAQHFEYFLDYQILFLKGKILQEKQIIYTWTQENPQISEALKAVFKKLKPGDQIIIDTATVQLDPKYGAADSQSIDPTIFEVK